ncbi:substrate-binding domain-containing protein, partial [Rhizobiaceae sp. 2RAB30]
IALGALTVLAAPTWAQNDLGPDQVGRADFMDALKGKRVVMVPISTGTDLVESWLKILRRQADQYGYTLNVRDPNWSTDAGTKAITAALAEKPDLLIVQNPDIQSYARLLKRAQAEGVKVLQINMPSLTQSEGYVGVDWVSLGEEAGRALVAKCGGNDGPSKK